MIEVAPIREGYHFTYRRKYRHDDGAAQRLDVFVAQPHAASANHLADVLAFQGDAPQFDDVTLLIAALDRAVND